VASKGAEASFNRGMEALKTSGREREALALFEAALTLDSRASGTSGAPRYRSFYGLCLGLYGGKMRQGLALCRKAAEEEFYQPDVWRNLGRLEMEAGNRPEAHAAFVRALRLAPRDSELRRLLVVLGMRRTPIVPFLSRSNRVNVFLGRLTYRGKKRR
jgi:tetratricopeptide (TPR) repeat protein